jgi:outer membrane protein assembly factor BamB
MKTQWCSILAVSLILCSIVALANDWPQWRGPGRNGISQEKGLLKEWPAGGPKLLWQQKDIGEGYSTPVIVGARLYILSNRGLENEFVQALSVEDGKPLWQTRLGNVGNPNQQPPYPMARSTPTIEGDVMYVLSSDGDLASLDIATGKIRWQKSLRKDFGGMPGTWAYAESPLIDGDVLIATPGGAQATLVALNKKSGDVVWKSAVPGGDEAGYASAVVVNGGGKKQYVQFLAKGVVGVDTKGKFLWRYDQTGKGVANMPTPVVKDGYVYSAAQNVGGGLVQLKPSGDGVTAEQVYYTRDLPNKNGGSILLGDYLYGTNSMGLVAAEFLTGKIKWMAEGIGPGSVFYADGNIYVHGENGDVALVEATPDAYHEKGRFSPPDKPQHTRGPMEKAWPYPVLANGRLYIRDLGTLWCYDVRDPRAAKK